MKESKFPAVSALVLALTSVLCSAQVEIPNAAKPISARYYKIGGKVRPPKPIDIAEPRITKADVALARKAKAVGTVTLWIGIASDGSVEAAYVVRSLARELDNKALEAVRQWKFQPATRDGAPVPVQTNVEVNFQIH